MKTNTTLVVHDCTPPIGWRRSSVDSRCRVGETMEDCARRISAELRAAMPALAKLATGQTIGEFGRSTQYCLESARKWRADDVDYISLLEAAIAAGLVAAWSTFPENESFQTGDSDGMLVTNEDGTRGAVICKPRLSKLSRLADSESHVDGFAFRAGGGIPDVD